MPRGPNDISPPVFDPLSYRSLGSATAEALMEREVVPMGMLPSFKGEGIYAIYYHGDFEPYEVISEANDQDQWSMPIYVGKADPPGGRHGVPTEGDEELTRTAPALSDSYCLRDRLRHHVRSIQAAENLQLEHFWCRFMLVNQVWVGLGEGMMISRHTPIWNSPINGFGNNTPGAGRPGTMGRSRWDTLHPGRAWALGQPNRPETAAQIANEVRAILAPRRRAPTPPAFDID